MAITMCLLSGPQDNPCALPGSCHLNVVLRSGANGQQHTRRVAIASFCADLLWRAFCIESPILDIQKLPRKTHPIGEPWLDISLTRCSWIVIRNQVFTNFGLTSCCMQVDTMNPHALRVVRPRYMSCAGRKRSLSVLHPTEGPSTFDASLCK